jgi:hypothetical protein
MAKTLVIDPVKTASGQGIRSEVSKSISSLSHPAGRPSNTNTVKRNAQSGETRVSSSKEAGQNKEHR